MGPILARKFTRFTDVSQTILDFGCGDAGIVSSLPAARRIAVEPNPASRAAHDARLVESHASLDAVPNATADLVISNHALEHCLHPLTDLRDMRRVLKPDGRLVLIVPIDDWRVQRKYDPADVNHHLYTWTPRLLGNLLTEAGFSVERIDIDRHAWPPGIYYVSRLPTALFDIVCRIWSRVSLVAEIRAIATTPP